MEFELKQHFSIESARFLPHLPKSHPCAHMHGHSFKIILTLVGEMDPHLGWVIDYNDIQNKMRPLLMQLDHKVLNDVEGLKNPTSEMLAYWIFERAGLVLPMLKRVSIAETPTTECSYPAR